MKHGMHILNVLLGLALSVESVFILVNALRPTHHLPLLFALLSTFVVGTAILSFLLIRRYGAIRDHPESGSTDGFNRRAMLFYRASLVLFLAATLTRIIVKW
jgi:hypothetical protein